MKLILLGFILFFATYSNSTDTYKNFEELRRAESTASYKIETLKRNADVLVLAPHGGFIEYGTSEIARSLAQNTWSYYSFMGLLKSGNRRLHITSSHFNEPRALLMAAENKVCITIHGYKARANGANICFGGLNDILKNKIHQKLVSERIQNFKDPNACGRFYGTDKSNIVNQCSLKGVQLEMSQQFRRLLLKDSQLQQRFQQSIHTVVEQYLKEKSGI